MRVPVVGVTTYREQARWGVWDERADVLHAAYADILTGCGAAVVLLPPGAPMLAGPVLDRLDGLVVAGGADVDPGAYGQEPHPATAGWRPDRDAWEMALLAAAEERGLPVLGICRGMQVMAVAAGGRLLQHVPDGVGHEQHSPGGPAFGDIGVRVDADSRVGALIGDRVTVRCHHHQAVAEHPGHRAVAWAEDGTVEAMEVPGDRFSVGVQWHPETLADVGLVAGFVDAAGRRGDTLAP